MEISENILAEDLVLFLKKQKTLVITDLHLGYEEYLQSSGYLVPRFQYNEIKTHLQKTLEKTKPEKIIINGDLKHEFGRIPQQEWDEVKGILDFLKQHTTNIKLVKGNHDNILGPIAKLKNVKLVKTGVSIGSTFITHGHKIPRIPTKAKTIIIGHEHPAIGISDNIITETYKCFLKGKWQGKDLVVQPSLCLVTEGTDVLKEKLLSPFLQQDLSRFECWTVADKVRYFGKLKNLLSNTTYKYEAQHKK